MQAEIIAIGDEITSGQLLDTNTQWLSQRLEELGVRVLFHTTVGDQLTPMAEVFRQAIDRAEVVIATGGLGPTADDLTREAVANATGRQLVVDQAALEHIRDMFARLRRKMPQRNERQASFPDGSRMIPNPNGTAPGIDLDIPREGNIPSRLFALPGVPAEMREMWHGSVARAVRQIVGQIAGQGLAGQGLVGQGRVIRHRKINSFGAGESQVEAMLPDLIRRGRQPQVGITASRTTIILRITAEGTTEEECHAAMEPTVATIRQCLGTLIFGEGDDQLQDAVVRLLRKNEKTLATVEWGTAGLVAQWLHSVPEAERHYLGGMVVGNESALGKLLDFPPELLERHSGTNDEVTRAMAVACRKRFDSDYALAVGRFPPFDSQAPKPFYISLAGPDGVQVKKFPYAGHPATLQIFSAKRALNVARLAMLLLVSCAVRLMFA